MARAVSFIEGTFRDYSRETSHYRLPVTTLTAANFNATNTAITALEAAIANITLGVQQKVATIAARTNVSSSLPSSPDAQREKKWLLTYHDANGGKFRTEIPCADLSLLGLNSDFIDQTNAAWTTLKTAFEAVVVSPDDQSAVVLDNAEFVGKRL